MWRDVQSLLWDGSLTSGVVSVAALLSVVAAIYIHLVLTRMTRRNRSDGKQFGVAIDPWVVEARRSYAREKLVAPRDQGKS